MQLRSGRSTLTATPATATRAGRAAARAVRRDSRNFIEFNERRRYQEEQKQLEESIYTTATEDTLQNRWKVIVKRIKHLLYFIECQRKQKCTLTEKLNTIKEIYEFILYHIDDMIELFNGEMKHNKKFPGVLYNKGNHLRWEINTAAEKRTRSEQKLAGECNDVINHVSQVIYRYILSTH
jgi:hypothetical protein